jgi:RNA polymerase sigma-70 factor (ECF subfamily)
MRATPDTGELLDRAKHGDDTAFGQLLARHRERLRHMVSVRIDERLSARVDPSDVVQEAMVVAVRKFEAYLREPALPFYPWLRRIAWERLVDLHRRHIVTEKRSVSREKSLGLSNESTMQFADQLKASNLRPLKRMLRRELHARVRAALALLNERDREILVLRHLEQLSSRESAAVLGIREDAAVQRHVRALRRFQRLLPEETRESN